jgi:hypothetical protein
VEKIGAFTGKIFGKFVEGAEPKALLANCGVAAIT